MHLSALLCLLCTVVDPTEAAQQEPQAEASATNTSDGRTDVLAKNNLVAWCIVPFDAANRTPAQRALMLKRLGVHKVAYDWRAKHVASFEQEILEYKKHGLEYFAFWAEQEEAFELFRKYKLHPQIWQIVPSPKQRSQEERIESAGRQLLPLLKKTRAIGSKLGLYNHGGWGGEPKNMIAVCDWLRKNGKTKDVGIVYNLHHGHNHIKDFETVLAKLKPYLLCLNINGMNDNAKPKILPIGKGQHDERLLRIIKKSDYQGPIGILDHRPELDAEQSLRENLDGLERVRKKL
ncbi:MAG: TIM barrel protein [Planctomycetaceae bacterium]